MEDYKVSGNCSKKHYAPHGEKVLLHVSNFRKVKRIEDVIAVFNKVRKEIKSKLILVGDGPERAHIETLARKSEFHTDIISLGRIPDPSEVMCIGDLFLLPSETESFGLAALEAMAMKMPVISTNAGGLPEVNIQGKTGFLSSVGNTDEMAANAIKILGDESLLQKFKANAYEHAKKFDVQNILPRYEEVYKQLLTEAKSLSTV